MQTGVLHSLFLVAQNRHRVLEQFWIKHNNSLNAGRNEAPFAWVIPAEQTRRADVSHLVNLLRRQGLEVHRADVAGTFGDVSVRQGDFVLRMDQPYRNFAMTLMEVQDFPQGAPRPYDDIAWTLPLLYNLEAHEVPDAAIQRHRMTLVTDSVMVPGSVRYMGGARAGQAWYVVPATASSRWLRARAQIGDREIYVSRAPIRVGTLEVGSGALLVPASPDPRAWLEPWARDNGVEVVGVPESAIRTVQRVPARMPRIAVLHTWQNTQDDGGVRYALDRMGVEYTYLPEDRLRATNLREQFDVVIFPEQGRGASAQQIFQGIDRRFSPMPYQPHPDFPSLGVHSQTDDVTGGMGYEGLAALRDFMNAGGTLITLGSATTVPVEMGLVRGVSTANPPGLFAPGSIVTGRTVRSDHPIASGYGETMPLFARFGPWLDVDASLREHVVVRFGDQNELVLSGLVDNPQHLAGRPAVVSLPVGSGRAVLFGFNPLHRYQTQGMFGLVWNAIVNWDQM